MKKRNQKHRSCGAPHPRMTSVGGLPSSYANWEMVQQQPILDTLVQIQLYTKYNV
jgi:hypothetical protein